MLAPGFWKFHSAVEDLGQRYEAGIANDDVDRLGYDFGGQFAGVGLLVDDNPRVAAQRRQAGWYRRRPHKPLPLRGSANIGEAAGQASNT